MKAINNTAAMREALDDILDRIDTWRGEGSMEHWQYSQLFDIADAALAAAPRNCDLYNSYGDAIRAFEDAEDAEEYEEMADWLYASAPGAGELARRPDTKGAEQ